MKKDDKFKVKIVYKCPICRKEYNTHEDAEKCVNKGYDEPLLKVGDKIKYKFYEEIREFEIIDIRRSHGHYLLYQLGLYGSRYIQGSKDPYAIKKLRELDLLHRSALHIYPFISSNKELLDILNSYNNGGEK